MRIRPPVLATWLLELFANHNPALVGDLLEEYQTGRSALWFWRQVLTAILVCFNSIRAHKWLALRALVIGWIFLEGASLLAFLFAHHLLMRLLETGIATRQVLFNWLFPVSTSLLMFIISLSAGWLVARTHRPHSIPMVLLLLASVLLSMVPTLPWFFRLLKDTFENSRYIPSFVFLVSRYALSIMSMLIGGVLGSSRLPHQSNPQSQAVEI
jgi:hypothetical protein